MKEKSKNQIYRSDGRAKFVEVINSGFQFGKVELNFETYDISREKGKRITSEINIFVDIPKWLCLTQDVLSGRILAMLKKDTSKPAFIDMGGKAAAKADRPDRMCLSRQLKIQSGNSGFLVVAESGPGKESETGLIVPTYGANPECKIAIPFTPDTMKQMLLITQQHIQAYLSAQYLYLEKDARAAAKAS